MRQTIIIQISGIITALLLTVFLIIGLEWSVENATIMAVLGYFIVCNLAMNVIMFEELEVKTK